MRIKADKSPVTEADVRCEIAIREILETRFPTYGFFGEETGSRGEDAEYLWLVDPIDGTKAFIREYPMFSTQIALMRRGELVLGVSSAPVYGELAYAERGRGAYLNGRALAVSGVSTLESATLSSGNMKSLATGPRWSRYGELVARLNRIRGYGDFLHYHLLAAGKIDAVVETDVNILDICACAAIVTRGRWPLHGARRCTDHIAFDLGARHQRSSSRCDSGGARLGRGRRRVKHVHLR